MSAGAIKGPRVGSRLYSWLLRLHEIGGRASAQAWCVATGFDGTITRFQLEAEILIGHGVVFLQAGQFVVTDAGLVRLGLVDQVAEPVQMPVAGPRYCAPQRPLSSTNIPKLRTMRAGALDYRDIPSRMGDRCLPHGVRE